LIIDGESTETWSVKIKMGRGTRALEEERKERRGFITYTNHAWIFMGLNIFTGNQAGFFHVRKDLLQKNNIAW